MHLWGQTDSSRIIAHYTMLIAEVTMGVGDYHGILTIAVFVAEVIR